MNSWWLWLLACGGPEARIPAPAPPAVAVAVARLPPETHQRSYVSVVEPRQDAVVAAQVAGQVLERLVRVGDAVDMGAPLVRLDARQSRANLAQARAALADATVTAGAAARALERVVKLGDSASEAQTDQARTAADRAQAGVEAARAQEELAALALSWTTLRAPFAGTVAQIAVDVGELLGPGSPVVRVVDDSGFVVRVELAEDAVRVATRSRFTVVEGPHRWPATVQSVAPAADPRTLSWQVELLLEPHEGLLAGLPVTVEGELAQPAADAVVPLRAVSDGGVWVVQEGTAVRREVTVVAEGSPDLRLRGVQPGEQVILRGPADLSDGDAVRAVEGVP